MVLWDFKEWVVPKPSVTPALGQDSAMALVFAANMDGASGIREGHMASIECRPLLTWYASEFFQQQFIVGCVGGLCP